MEADLTTPDDPPESHDNSRDVEKEKEPSEELTGLPSKEQAGQLPEMPCSNQSGQDETAIEEAGTDDSQTARKATKKSPCKMQQGAIFSGKILSFCCSECKGDTTYSPNDLLKHFQGSHQGTLPTYPCDLCSFVTNEFSALQRHRIGHRNTLVTCEICNDGVQYSLLLLTRHYIMCHSRNGHFHCEKCEFSTRDAGTFVQHIHHHNESRHKCVKCKHVSPSRGELQRHLQVHSGTFPFTCQFCGYGAARKDYLSKHMNAVHGEEMERKNRWRAMEDKTRANSSPAGLKLLLKKSPAAGGSRETQWMSKLHSLTGVGLLDQNGRLLNPEKTLEETQQFLERAVGVKKESNKWIKGALKSEPQCSYPATPATPQPKLQEGDLTPGAGLLNPSNSNGLTVLMVKNKISIPPNCTTKVMGFKMVDGKKHLVLKVIPTKQEPSPQNEVSPTENCHSAEATVNERTFPDSADGESATSSPCSAVSSRLGSLLSPESGESSVSRESSVSGAKKDFTTSIKIEAQEVENDIGVPLLEEHDGGSDRTINSDQQVCPEAHENHDGRLPYFSASHCVDSSLTKESQSSMQFSSQPNGKTLSHVDELAPSHSTANDTRSSSIVDETKTSDSIVDETTPPDSIVDETAPTDSIMGETTPSDSIMDATTPSDSIVDETTPPDSIVDETTPPDSVMGETTPSDSIVDETTPSDSIVGETTPPDSIVDETTPPDSIVDETTPPDSIMGETTPSDTFVDEITHPDNIMGDTTPPDSITDETTPSDSIVDKTTPPDSRMGETTPPDSIMDETTPSDAVMGETTSSDAALNETTAPDAIPNGNPDAGTIADEAAIDTAVPPTEQLSDATLPADSIADETPPKLVSDENHIPPSDSTTDASSHSDHSEDLCPSKCIIENNPPMEDHVEKSTPPDAVSGPTPSPDETPSSADKTLSSDSLAEDTCQPDSITNQVLLPDCTADKTPPLDNKVDDTKSSDLMTNEAKRPELIPQIQESISGESVDSSSIEIPARHSPSQEVFSFHNYSKETSSNSPSSLQPGQHPSPSQTEDNEEDCSDMKVPSDWCLTLADSPPHETGQPGEEEVVSEEVGSVEESATALERVSDSDIEVDECIATVEDPSIPMLPENSNKIACSSLLGKKEEDSVAPVGERGMGSLNDAAVLGKILEKHSDAIISHQLEKERMGSSTAGQDVGQPTKTMLRILQTPEGKQQMFLQTSKNPYAVPVQLKSGPGFKLITKSSGSKINVSYMKPGMERQGKTTGLAFTLNGGRIGMSAQGASCGEKGPAHLSSVQHAVSTSGNRYLINATALKGPLLLSGAVKSPAEQTTNMPPTCYLVQRPLPVTPVVRSAGQEPTGSSSQTLLTSLPVLAMPVNSADKTTPLHTGRQAYLVRYISPAKSGILLNNPEGKPANQSSQPNDSGRNRVFLKIFRSPNGTRFLSSGPYSSAKKPIYLATGTQQSPFFLMSSNKSFISVSAGAKTSNTLQGATYKTILPSQLFLQPTAQVITRNGDGVGVPEKTQLVPRQTRQRSQRKRRRKALFEDSQETSPKARKISSKSFADKEGPSIWEPVPKDVERTLRLSPFSPLQQIKCPRRNQPVVVLNHPDADIPEVASIMESINRFKGEVRKVALSQRTIKALSELSLTGVPRTSSDSSKHPVSQGSGGARVQSSESTVRERFVLKLKLKKTSRNKYEVVRSSSNISAEQPSTFGCWFCGRVFSNQEEWIGHGQRHLMEATRDWNKLF